MTKPGVQDTVSNLDHNVVTEVLSRHACNVTDAAAELRVPASDLRRLMWANPQLQDAAFEAVESRLDQAEKNIAEALHSDDNRERLAASMFVVRNSARSRRRGWITSTVAPDLAASVDQPSTVVFRWQSSDGKEYDPPMDEVTRDGRRIQVPRYGGTADPVEGELVAPPVLIEHVEPEIHVEPSPIPKWQGPYGPPPLLAHLYQPWTPPPMPEPPQPEPRRRMSRGGYR